MSRRKSRAQKRRAQQKQQPKFWTKTKMFVAGSILALGLLGSVIAIAYNHSNNEESTTSASVLPAQTERSPLETIANEFSIQSVRAGSLTPEEYVTYKNQTMPEIVAAQENGSFMGFYYVDSPEKLDEPASRILEAFGFSPNTEDFEYNKRTLLEKLLPDRYNGTFMTTVIETATYGTGMPTFTVVWPETFTSEGATTDDEYESMSLHDLGHVKAYNSGDRTAVELVRSGAISEEFFTAFKEVPEYTNQIIDFLENPNADITDIFKKAILNQLVYYSSLVLCPSSQPDAESAEEISKQILGDIPFIIDIVGDKVLVRNETSGQSLETEYIPGSLVNCGQN